MLPMPAFAAKLVFGEMGEELMLASTRVVPEKLRSSGYGFKDKDIESALQTALAEHPA
jgi:NAD dependent epimerase/dehydratase family enzyme